MTRRLSSALGSFRSRPCDLGAYVWTGRSIGGHRAQIREHLGYRECSVADAERLTTWLAEHVGERERRPERVRDELLARCHSERIERPASARIDRVVRSALHASEALSSRVTSRLTEHSREQIEVLLAVSDDDATRRADRRRHIRSAARACGTSDLPSRRSPCVSAHWIRTSSPSGTRAIPARARRGQHARRTRGAGNEAVTRGQSGRARVVGPLRSVACQPSALWACRALAMASRAARRARSARA
jgi:hypothetical protein